MFGTTLLCGIQKVGVKAKDVDGRLVRRCRITLVHEFTEDIARELGADAKAVLNGVRSGGLHTVRMPIEELAMLGVFTGAHGECVEIGRMVGVKATAKAGKDDVSGPTIAFELDFEWQPDAWVFLGENCNAMADVVLTKRQLTLALEGSAN